MKGLGIEDVEVVGIEISGRVVIVKGSSLTAKRKFQKKWKYVQQQSVSSDVEERMMPSHDLRSTITAIKVFHPLSPIL